MAPYRVKATMRIAESLPRRVPPELLGPLMNPSRRTLLKTAASGLFIAGSIQPVWPQAYPLRPVRIIVGYPAGGVGDIVARVTGQWLTGRLGQQFVIDDKPGANSNLGTEAAIRAIPDGYTLLLATSSNAINASLYQNLNFNFVQDVVPVSTLMRVANVMVVPNSLPVKTLPEFIAYAKARPGKINMASGGIGSSQHVYGELFKMMTGVDMVHVPYQGSPQAMPDLINGRMQVMFDTVATSIGYVKSGKLRALAVTTAARLEVLPDVPTVAEFVPGYEASGWLGIAAPKNTPARIIDVLNREIIAGLADPAIKARFAGLGGTTFPQSSAAFAKFIGEETNKWAKVIKFAGIKAS